jgi:cytochrome oxidase Cu insertion factor (SCO1/SenC/PrrC family)
VTARATARTLAVAAWLVLASAAWLTAAAHEPDALPALDFEPPAPGTYTLQRIMAAPDGEVVGLDGRPQRLATLTRERITLLGFIYTTCVDPEGCPRAYQVFDAVREAVGAMPALRERVRLVTLSFDPARDTPGTMARYAGSRARPGVVPWLFLTTRSAREVMPLVEGFGQDIRYTVDASGGTPRRELAHVLKVFLIDRAGYIREIYSSTFLHPRTVLNDIETLLLEDRGR